MLIAERFRVSSSIAAVIASGGREGFNFSKATRKRPANTASIFVVRPSETPSPFGNRSAVEMDEFKGSG
jgi:hypothetical protein